MILKVLKDKEETYIDTHEQFYEEREAEIQEIGDEIIEEFEDYYVDNCNCVVESDDYRSWVSVDDAPDYQEELDKLIQYYINHNDYDDDFINDLKDYVYDNVASEDDLLDRAKERYNDRADEGPDYD